MKIMVIQEDGEAKEQLIEFLTQRGADVIQSPPSWPGYFQTARQERPDVAIVDCSPDPGYGRECAGYLGETGFTNQIRVFCINVPPNDTARLKRRAPKSHIVHLDDLETELKKLDPEFGQDD